MTAHRSRVLQGQLRAHALIVRMVPVLRSWGNTDWLAHVRQPGTLDGNMQSQTSRIETRMAKLVTTRGLAYAPRRAMTVLAWCGLIALGGCNAEDSRSGEVQANAVASAVGDEVPAGTGASTGRDDSERTTGTPGDQGMPRDDEERTAMPVPAVPAADLAPAAVDDESAEDLVAPVIESTAALLADPLGLDVSGLEVLVSDEALAQTRAQTLEYSVMGWHQVGSPEVVSARVIEVSESEEPPRAEVEVCLDHTDVDILDESGLSIVDPTAQRRVLTIFILEYRDQAWVTIDRQFPVETAC